ncbi:kinase-like protein [Trametes coccinea BRFM310]|uniref:non-specific serine/threonine protein kinase n=1 Tax=Trametes coccinea (strain BRFM310) TaxID=1353009 RepID=A0A1Y2J1X1_TRAC3|nr:kinase-like protein [Trametes coccinea BRFM310]
MASARRPLPTPPVNGPRNDLDNFYPSGGVPGGFPDMYSYGNPYMTPYPYQPTMSPPPAPSTPEYEPPSATLRGGTLLHKGFYDLLALIPSIPSTPSPSRLFWPRAQNADTEPIAGPRYEELRNGPPAVPKAAPVPAPPVSPSPPRNIKARRISKDMVSRPTGFVHLVHASDADQAEALLTRWGPEGQGKLGDPRWADPIKDRVRYMNQAKAINEVVSALKPTPSSSDAPSNQALRVVNGMSTTTSSVITTAARENVSLSPLSPTIQPQSPSYQTQIPPSPAQLSPSLGQPGNSTIRWTSGLPAHPEHEQEEAAALDADKDYPEIPTPQPKKPITPSLATLEKAVAAKIYFENIYFALLRHPPSREQRRVALEREMAVMQLSEAQKENIRRRWRQNETDYLRDRRRKVDVNAFVKLKTIGHGAFGVVSLVRERSTGQLFAMKQLRKTDMLRKGQEGHVRAERDLLRSASLVSTPGSAEWIVKLFYSFQDRDHLYLVLEYMGGGDLLNLLIERDVFEEDFTRFYVAEMVLAVESCHKHGFIHRDIKPDNFLFDPEGHIKLSDFGLATDLHWAHDTSYYEQQRLHLLHKHGIDLEESNGLGDGMRTKRLDRKEVERLMGGGDGQSGVFTWREKHRRKLAYSVCGTNSYMSPEVIRGHGYTFSCDWWSLGVIMFECLYGFPPFVSNSRHVTRQKILNWKQSLRFPSRPRVSHEAVNLMEQLLCEPEDRLGSQATASVSRPNSMIIQARRSGFITPQGTTGSVDGAHLIKAHPWFRGIDWENIHRYPAPYRPELRSPEDTRHFDDDIPPEPLAPANGAAADATRDPLLRDKVHGGEILEVRKALAFAGFTHKSPRAISYVRADKAFDPEPDTYGQAEPERGRSTFREVRDVGTGRAMSL